MSEKQIENPSNAHVETADTDALLDELLSRGKAVLLLWVHSQGEIELLWRGTAVSAMGLARYAEKRIFDLIVNNDKE